MKKPFLTRLGERYKLIIAIALVIMGILMALGYYLDDRKTWRPPRDEDPEVRFPETAQPTKDSGE